MIVSKIIAIYYILLINFYTLNILIILKIRNDIKREIEEYPSDKNIISIFDTITIAVSKFDKLSLKNSLNPNPVSLSSLSDKLYYIIVLFKNFIVCEADSEKRDSNVNRKILVVTMSILNISYKIN